MPNFHRVVITGIGAVTPIGNNIDEYLVGLQTGTNGVSDITLFDPEEHPCKFAAEVKSDSNFQNDLGADSLDTVELVMALEEAFDIEIPDEAAEGIATVGDAVKFIEEKKG